MTILVAGHVCVDLTPALTRAIPEGAGRLHSVGPLRVALGGSIANTGRALVGLGYSVKALAAVGDDTLGDLASSLFGEAGFDATGVRRLPGVGTSYSIVLEPPGFDRTFWHHSGANDEFDPGDDVDFDGVRILHVGYPSLLGSLARNDGAPLAALFTRARAAGVATSLDLAVVDPDSPAAAIDWERFLGHVLPVTDVFSPSVDDLASALGDATNAMARAEQAVASGAGIALVSAGADELALAAAGASRLREAPTVVARIAERWADARVRLVPPPLPNVVTTNGAGDASTAGLLAAVLEELAPETAIRRAMDCAAAVVGGGLPDRTEARRP